MTTTAVQKDLAEKRFFVGPVSADFDHTNDIVAGWWCFSDQEAAHPDWDILQLQEPIPDPVDVVTELRAINALVNDLIIEWTPRWNEMHGVERSAKFWHILSVAWLIDLVHLVRYRYLEIQNVLNTYSDQQFSAQVVPADQRFEFSGYSDFAPASYADQSLSEWIASIVLHEISAPNVTFVIKEQTQPKIFDAKAYVPPQRSILWGALRSLKASLKPDRCRIGSGGREFTPWLKFSTLFSEITLASICRLSLSKSDLNYTAPTPSKGALKDHFSTVFLKILDQAIQGTMPTSMTTGFNNLDRMTRDLAYRPGHIRMEMSFFHLNEERKFKIAHAVENDEVLIGVQHGGNAGTAAAIQFAPESEYRYHGAITWGWTSCGGYPGNFIPLPSAHLAPWINKHNPTDDTIVVVGTGVRFIPGRFSFEGDIFNRPTSRHEKCAFFDGLASEPRAKIRYRPYFGMQSTVSDASYIEDKYPDIPLIRDDFFTHLMRCKLMVIDHPGTTMLQALAAGIPFIGFWSPKAFYMCPEAEEKFDALRKTHVIFNNGSDAARHINDIAGDINGWWSSKDVQNAIADVRDTYALTSKTWLIDWAKMLIRL